MAKKKQERKRYSDDLKREAVRMLLEGYSASSISSNLGISNSNMIHNWKKKFVGESPEAESLEAQVRQLREQLSRAERERDILKKALSIFSQKM
jgi:transposase